MTLLRGSNLDRLPELPDNSIDTIVTDPPYELGFMGKAWDSSGIAYNVDLWRECLRVLKPGGHLLAFGGSRTYHRLACAVEDAGFEIRDQIMWIYGSGFPKSMDVGKAIDNAAGAGRPDRLVETSTKSGSHENPTRHVTNPGRPATPEAERWQGWGTALKPAHEPIVVARKPLGGTVAANVLTYGTGALNIDGCRVGDETVITNHTSRPGGDAVVGRGAKATGESTEHDGRWPANVIHDGSDELLAGFPITAPSRKGKPRGTAKKGMFANSEFNAVGSEYDGEGFAARFFYCAKASRAERNAGMEGLPELTGGEATNRVDGSDGLKSPRAGAGRNGGSRNHHPTVKPLALMRYLVRLVTSPGGVVLDPFLGSGTTAVAAILEGFDWLGCEMTDDYWPIIEARVAWAEAQPKKLL